MRDIRESIKQDKFPEFVQIFMKTMFPDNTYPDWAVNALVSVNITLDSCQTVDRKQEKPLENITPSECNSSVIKWKRTKNSYSTLF